METNSLVYSIPYLCFFSVLLYFALIDERYQDKYHNLSIQIRFCTILLIVIFYGLRGFVATDWYTYFPLFKDFPTDLNSIQSDSFLEPGFSCLILFSKLISTNYHTFIFLNVLIDVVLLHVLFNRYVSKHYILAFVVYFAFCTGLEINLLRNIKAILIFFISLKYLQERKLLKYVLLNLVGLAFHSSAIFFLPLYFFVHKNIKIPLIVLFIIGNIVFLFKIEYIIPILEAVVSVLKGKYEVMLASYSKTIESGFTLGFFDRFLTAILLFYFYDKVYRSNSINIIFVNLLFLYILSNLYFFEILILRDRISALFIVSYCFVFPNLLDVIKINNNKLIYLISIIVLMLLKTYTSNSNILQKYDNLLFGIKPYEERKELFEEIGNYK